MITINQLKFKKYIRSKKYHKCRTPALKHCPQKKGVILNIVIITPKKPNSAKRHIAKLRLSSGKRIRASIPGEFDSKNKPLKQYSKVLVRGGRIRDIIGLRYKIILGQFDAKPFYKRRTSRSKYGVKLSDIKN
jgi:small subunit ribosomal protein S12